MVARPSRVGHREIRRDFQHAERAPRVAVAAVRERHERLVVDDELRLPRPRSVSSSARRSSLTRSSRLERLQHVDRARDSSALMTSNDGFSVVAPMKVSVPSSTYGRNASCCALLKRCTSSTKRTVRRPRSARAVCARSTASRMSLTPAKHRRERMNSASGVAP